MNRENNNLSVILLVLAFFPYCLQAGNVKIFTSAKADSSYMQDCSKLASRPDYKRGMDIRLFPKVRYQTFYGFGTCMSDGNAAAAMGLDENMREEAVRLLFSTDRGNGYVFCRVPMGSNDFSTCDYVCVKEGDADLKTFNIREDKRNIIPVLTLAQHFSPSLRLMVSPWSPPVFMKTNANRLQGGKLRPEYYDAWAEYFAKFISAYSSEGLITEFVTIQNEPQAVQTWESCIWTGREEGEFATAFLRRHLDNSGLDSVKILFWDHNRDLVILRAEATLGVPGAREALDGIAHHWYAGDNFAQLRGFHQLYPEMLIVESEFCSGPNKGRTSMPYGVWDDLELYAHEVIGNLNNYTNVIFDFNSFLDTKAGPFHNRNIGGIPSIVVDAKNKRITPQPHYYAMGHFSRYIRPGARIILSSCSSENSDIEMTAAENEDGSIVCVILNSSDNNRSARLFLPEKTVTDNLMLPAHSLTTVNIR